MAGLKSFINKKRALWRIEQARKTGATYLDLAELGLEEVPLEIGNLTMLETLSLGGFLSRNQITTLPPEIGNLTNLTSLDLSGNRITTLPPEIGKLTKLERLSLGGLLSRNQITTLPPEIGNLTSLTNLVLSRNQISVLPKEIGQLTALTSLSLNGNQISVLSKEIGQLTALTSLSLSGNQISVLPKEIGQLTALTNLDLSENKITTLPPEIGNLSNIEEITLQGNPLTSPPLEIAEKGIDAIREYFEALGKEEVGAPSEVRVPLNEVKVLLVGDGGAGKTSLVKRLLDKTFNPNESQTHGININDWNLNLNDQDVTIHFWDFGGQEIMHATHQFFLSKRSLYVLVLDGRREEKIDYWLKYIESFGGDSPVLVVLNKIDENPSFDANRSDLKQKYPLIHGFHRVSCAQGTGIKDFMKGLRMTMTEMPLLRTVWPKSWLDVKNRLEKRKDEFISYETYTRICQKENVTKKAAQDTLVDFLHDLGVILHFRDFRLQDTHVLDPGWVTGAIYRIITSRELIDTKGVLPLQRLDELLAPRKEDRYRYPRDKHPYLIDLMRKFELCYPLDDTTILIPSLLGIQPPKFTFDYKNSLKFLIEYDFLPKSLFSRFVVKMHSNIKDQLSWRSGVVLENEKLGTTAVVSVEAEARRISINVQGDRKREYLTVIVHFLRELADSFEKLKVMEKVTLPDKPKVAVGYNFLLKLEKRGTKTCFPEEADHEYNVKELLGSTSVEIGSANPVVVNIINSVIKDSIVGCSIKDSTVVLQRGGEDEDP